MARRAGYRPVPIYFIRDTSNRKGLCMPPTPETRTTPAAAEHNVHLTYRPDIDGLRAIAILSVVVFHAFPAFLQGGFIGVDIFFVISGFLISSIIFRSLKRGTFNLAEFYVHRIKRIFPALLLVLSVCISLGTLPLKSIDPQVLPNSPEQRQPLTVPRGTSIAHGC